SGVAIRIEASKAPVLAGALEYAKRGILTGGAERNRKYLTDKVRVGAGVPEPLEHVLFDPQTSGGLLLALAPERAQDAEAAFKAAGLPLFSVGAVVEGTGVGVGL
ncbi:MAG TPA: AIR synthase-related protein, partial [Dehalococcoidia bacterium]|nr:AIR synthase-related protein [Dehalococcoidia bacterium]